MIFILSILLLLYFLLKKERRLYIFIYTIIMSVILFSSKDPFFGIPIYFYGMILSIIICFDRKNSLFDFKNIKLFMIIILICFFMIVQIVNIIDGNNVIPVILLKNSTTDILDINSQLIIPEFNFTIVKHFVFFVVYLIFVLCNSDLLSDDKCIHFCHEIIIKVFKILFICIIIESLVVNLFGGLNDRSIMDFVFSMTSNQSYNWKTFGIYSVCFCFTERSYIDCILIYYLIVALKKNFDKKFLKWFIISGIAIFCTGSSTGLAIFLIFGLYFLYRILLVKNSFAIKISFLCIILTILVLIIVNPDLLDKITNYMSYEEGWNSSYFRRRSNEYGLDAFKFSPFIGMGIGTVYCHSVLIQTLANIGLIGFILTIVFHIIACQKNSFNFDLLIKIVIICIIGVSAYMIQEFTSPYLLCVFISLSSKKNICTNLNYSYDGLNMPQTSNIFERK